MIQLALTIASFLFLLWIGAIFLALTSNVLLPLAVIALVFVIIAMNKQEPPVSVPPSAPAYQWRPLPERLRATPPLIVTVKNGTAWFVSAVESQPDKLIVLVEFSGNEGRRLIKNGSAELRQLLRSELCGSTGMLQQYRLKPIDIKLVAYEAKKRVAEVELTSEYCNENSLLPK